MRRRGLLVLGLVSMLAGSGLAGQLVYLRLKAALAAKLIEDAFAAYLLDGRPRPPWSWADMHPVASLHIPRLGLNRMVLSEASGRALAFGLGRVSGTAVPGEAGNAAVAGHRDSWAAFMRHLRPGDAIVARTVRGTRQYRVRRLSVVRWDRAEVLHPSAAARLTLITCYPLRGVLPSPWRYVVVAEADAKD